MEGLVEDGFELRGGTGGAFRSLHSSFTCSKEEHVSKQWENVGNGILSQMKHIWLCLTLQQEIIKNGEEKTDANYMHLKQHVAVTEKYKRKLSTNTATRDLF